MGGAKVKKGRGSRARDSGERLHQFFPPSPSCLSSPVFFQGASPAPHSLLPLCQPLSPAARPWQSLPHCDLLGSLGQLKSGSGCSGAASGSYKWWLVENALGVGPGGPLLPNPAPQGAVAAEPSAFTSFVSLAVGSLAGPGFPGLEMDLHVLSGRTPTLGAQRPHIVCVWMCVSVSAT